MIKVVQVLVLVSCLSGAVLAPVASTQAATALTVRVVVIPNLVVYGSYPTLSVQTVPYASCLISVTYSTGSGPTSYPPHTTQANAMGRIVEQGQWHMESSGTGGAATVSCTARVRSGTGVGQFTIA